LLILVLLLVLILMLVLVLVLLLLVVVVMVSKEKEEKGTQLSRRKLLSFVVSGNPTTWVQRRIHYTYYAYYLY
jgi:heme/copper-type cytochrome/quinol oxidase subunit 2